MNVIDLSADEVNVLSHLTYETNYRTGTPTLNLLAQVARYTDDGLYRILEGLQLKGLLAVVSPAPGPFANDVFLDPTRRLRMTPDAFRELKARENRYPFLNR